jgi:hypothetical protein
MSGDGHQRGIGGAGFRHFGDGLVAEVVETQAADRRGGSFPACDRAAKTIAGFERLLCGLPADAPGGFANEFSPRRAPAFSAGDSSLYFDWKKSPEFR